VADRKARLPPRNDACAAVPTQMNDPIMLLVFEAFRFLPQAEDVGAL